MPRLPEEVEVEEGAVVPEEQLMALGSADFMLNSFPDQPQQPQPMTLAVNSRARRPGILSLVAGSVVGNRVSSDASAHVVSTTPTAAFTTPQGAQPQAAGQALQQAAVPASDSAVSTVAVASSADGNGALPPGVMVNISVRSTEWLRVPDRMDAAADSAAFALLTASGRGVGSGFGAPGSRQYASADDMVNLLACFARSDSGVDMATQLQGHLEALAAAAPTGNNSQRTSVTMIDAFDVARMHVSGAGTITGSAPSTSSATPGDITFNGGVVDDVRQLCQPLQLFAGLDPAGLIPELQYQQHLHQHQHQADGTTASAPAVISVARKLRVKVEVAAEEGGAPGPVRQQPLRAAQAQAQALALVVKLEQQQAAEEHIDVLLLGVPQQERRRRLPHDDDADRDYVCSEGEGEQAAAERGDVDDGKAAKGRASSATGSPAHKGKRNGGGPGKAAQARAKAQVAVEWPVGLQAEPAAAAQDYEAAGGSGGGGGGELEARSRQVTLADLKLYYESPIKSASKALGFSLSCFKKLCRRLGVPRWPARKLLCLKKMRDALRAAGSDCGGRGSSIDSEISAEERERLLERVKLNIAEIYDNPDTPMYGEFTRVRHLQYKSRTTSSATTRLPLHQCVR
eukprot:XP_001698973.1 RWP-RK transcription factor [Chlamydomonas reinhardtii]